MDISDRLSFPSNIMPLDIIYITTLFIDDHLMLTRGYSDKFTYELYCS